MKKNYKKIFLLLSFMLLLPFTVLLTGCGATPARNVQTIKFVSETYDKTTGYAIFEVDMNVKTTLTYKVTPSTGIGSPKCSVYVFNNNPESTEDSEINRPRFQLENEYITVIDEMFQEIVVKIELGDLEDYCIVRLKKYPDKLYINRACTLTETTGYINAYGEYTIHVFGNYSPDPENPDIRELKDTDFKFRVESNDTTVIKVLNDSRLKVCSLKNKIETATVTVYMLDTTGNVLLYADGSEVKVSIKLTVVLSPSVANIMVDGYGKFIEPGETITINADDSFETELSPSGEWSYYLVGFEVDLFTDTGIYITDSMYTTTVTTDNDKFVKVDNKFNKLKFRRPTTGNTYDKPVVITITSSANNLLGEAFSVSFEINFVFPPAE